MADRKGFTAPERRAFLHGAKVLWEETYRWHPGVVVGTIRKDRTGRDYIAVKNTGPATKNVDAGEITRAYPGWVKKA
jgi:hypothetical protein